MKHLVLLIAFFSCCKSFSQDTTAMKQQISTLFEKAVQLKQNNVYSKSQRDANWVGNHPATAQQIEAAEQRLNIVLPDDYKIFLQIANGYSTCNDAVEPSFMQVQDIEYLVNLDKELIIAWAQHDTGTAATLKQSIVVGGMGEEQLFLLIPPAPGDTTWRYWKFAAWMPGEEAYANLSDYFDSVIDFIDSIKD